MMRNIRKNLQGTAAKVIVGIIVVPFALFGIESLLSGGGVQSVAEVNGDRVTAVELQQQINQQKRRLMMAFGDRIDPGMLDDQTLAGPALDFIIQKRLMMQAAEDYGMAVSDDRLGAFIASMEVFQQDGRFDPALFRRVVSDQGYSPAGFQRALRDDMIMNQLRSGVAGSTFATAFEVDRLARIKQERRDVRYTVLSLEQYRTDADVSDEAVQAWYEANQDQYMTEESVELAYVELTVDDFRDPVDEATLRDLYDAEQASFQLPEERRVSHILFEQGAEESDEAFQQRIYAAELRVDSGEESFVELAGELSDDLGSASLGGDLGYTSGDAFPPEMETVIAALDVNEISDPVETDAGWHLIQVTDIREGESRSFDDVRAELEARIQDERAGKDLIKAVERLRDLAFNAEDLVGPAEQLGLEVERSAPVTRGVAEGLFANPRVIAAAFSSDVLNEGYNSDVIELDPEHFVVLRVLEHNLPQLRSLAEVRDAIVADLREDIARGNIRDKATQLLGELRSGATIEEIAQANDLSWQVELASTRDNPGVPTSLLKRAFELPAPEPESSVFEYVQNADGDIEIFELVRVTPGEPGLINPGQRQQLDQQLVNEYGQHADNFFQQELRSRADISRS